MVAENTRTGARGVEAGAARRRAAFRDTTHYTRLLFSGGDHLGILHRLTTNHFLGLQPGEGFDAVFPDNRGRIVSWAGFTRLDDDKTLAVIPSSNGGQLIGWLDRFIFNEEVSIRDLTFETGAMDVIGPESVAILAGILPGLGGAGEPAPPHRLISTDSQMPWLLGLRFGRLAGVRVIGDPSTIQALVIWAA